MCWVFPRAEHRRIRVEIVNWNRQYLMRWLIIDGDLKGTKTMNMMNDGAPHCEVLLDRPLKCDPGYSNVWTDETSVE